MAGFLAPQISPVGGVQGAPVEQGVVDTSVGDALSNVGNIFDAVIQSGQREGTTGTQTDRNRAFLQRFTKDINRIGKLVRSGQMTSSEAQARTSKIVLEASALAPDKMTELREFASSVVGTEILAPQEDPVQQAESALMTEALDFTDPRNLRNTRKALLRARSEDGTVNEVRFERELFSLLAQKNAKAAENAALREEAEEAELTGRRDQARENQIAQTKFVDFTNEADDVVDDLIQSFAGQGPEIDVNDALQSVIAAKGELLSENSTLAAELRITDNFKTLYGGIEETVRPLTNLENQLRSMTKADLEAAQLRAALGPEKLAKALKSQGIPEFFAFTPEGREFIFSSAMNANLPNKKIDVEELNMMETVTENPWYRKNNGKAEVDDAAERRGSDQIVTPEGQAVQDTVTKDEAKKIVQGGISSFLLLGKKDSFSEREKDFAVKDFAIGLDVMNRRGFNFDEPSFDRLYGNSEFFEGYNRVVEEGGPRANMLNNTVRKHLRNQRLLKEEDVRADLRSIEQVPGAQVVFDGEKYTISLSSKPTSELQEVLLEALRNAGLPNTLEGLKQLDPRKFPATDRPIAGGPGVALFGLVNRTKDNLRLLNKIAGTVPKLSEDAQVGILPSETGAVSEDIVQADPNNFEQQFNDAPDGTIFEAANEAGEVVRIQKVNGRAVGL